MPQAGPVGEARPALCLGAGLWAAAAAVLPAGYARRLYQVTSMYRDLSKHLLNIIEKFYDSENSAFTQCVRDWGKRGLPPNTGVAAQ